MPNRDPDSAPKLPEPHAQRPTPTREYPERPFIGVGAIIIEDNRVLLVKRSHAPLAGEWSIPGGVLELGEMLRDAARREAQEETGLMVEPAELLGVYDRVLLDDKGETLYHFVLIDFLCRRTGGEVGAGGDAAEARWFGSEELDRLKLAKDTEEVIRLGFEKRRA